jgi:hypothetical protein
MRQSERLFRIKRTIPCPHDSSSGEANSPLKNRYVFVTEAVRFLLQKLTPRTPRTPRTPTTPTTPTTPERRDRRGDAGSAGSAGERGERGERGEPVGRNSPASLPNPKCASFAGLFRPTGSRVPGVPTAIPAIPAIIPYPPLANCSAISLLIGNSISPLIRTSTTTGPSVTANALSISPRSSGRRTRNPLAPNPIASRSSSG